MTTDGDIDLHKTPIKTPIWHVVVVLVGVATGVAHLEHRATTIEDKLDRADERHAEVMVRLDSVKSDDIVNRCVTLVLARQQSLDCFQFPTQRGRLRCVPTKE